MELRAATDRDPVAPATVAAAHRGSVLTRTSCVAPHVPTRIRANRQHQLAAWLRASPYKAAYVAAKHGLEGLSKVTALEGATHGITSNCISPGYVRSQLVEQQIAAQARVHGSGEDRVITDVMLAETAIKRLIEPSDVAELAVWLAGRNGAMATGVSFTLDGGWSAR